MKKYLFSKIKSKDAQDMVEFTIVLPVLLAMFVILFTIGQMGFNKQVAFNMVYHGCRRSVVADSETALSQGWDAAKLYTGQLIAADVNNIVYKIQVCNVADVSFMRNSSPFTPVSSAPEVSLKYSDYKNGSTGGAINSNVWKSPYSRDIFAGLSITNAYFCKSTIVIPATTLFPMKGWMGTTHEVATSTAMLIEYNPKTAYNPAERGMYSLN